MDKLRVLFSAFLWAFLCILVLASLPTAALAQFAQDTTLSFGGQAGIGVRNCSVGPGCPDATGGAFSPLLDFAQNTGVDERTVTISPANLSPQAAMLATGSAGQMTFGTATETGSFAVPTVRAGNYSTSVSRVSDGSWVLQGYTWNGTGPSTRTIDGLLAFSQTGGFPADTLTPPTSATGVEISIFTTGSSTATILADCALNPPSATTCLKNADVLANNSLTLADPTSRGSVDVSLPSITLSHPGETIFVLLSFNSFSKGGGFVDAADTFTATFSSEAGLKPASSVPEPATTLGLLGLGLSGVGFITRQRKRHGQAKNRDQW